jgi:hypothetical protein
MDIKKLMRECGIDETGSKRLKKDSSQYSNRLIWYINVKMGSN